MRIGATCPINKIERSISRLFRTNREDFLHVTLWCQRLHRGPQTAGIRVSRMNGDATGGSEAHTTRIKCINSVLVTPGFLSMGGSIVHFFQGRKSRATNVHCTMLLNYMIAKQARYRGYCSIDCTTRVVR